jgi:hypothetical protein
MSLEQNTLKNIAQTCSPPNYVHNNESGSTSSYLLSGGIRGLLVIAAGDDYDFEIVGGLSSFWSELLEEEADIRAIVCLSKVICQANLILACCLWSVVNGTIQGTQAQRSYVAHVAYLCYRLTCFVSTELGCIISQCQTIGLSKFANRLESRLLGLSTEERVGRLDCVDVLVKMSWERVAWRAYNISALLMLEDGEFGIKKLLNSLDWEIDVNPVFRRAVGQLPQVNPVLTEPVLYTRESAVCGLHKLRHFILGQMLAITFMVRVRDYSNSSANFMGQHGTAL